MANYKNILIGVIGGLATATISKIMDDSYNRRLTDVHMHSAVRDAMLYELWRDQDQRLDSVTPAPKYRKYRNQHPNDKIKTEFKSNKRKEDNNE